MDDETAVTRLAALGQSHRLALFRRLMRAGPSGLSAGTLAADCAMQPSALTFHAGHLERSGLVTSRREGRNVFYAVAVEEMRRLLVHLTEECCEGNPDICGGLAEIAVKHTTCETSRC